MIRARRWSLLALLLSAAPGARAQPEGPPLSAALPAEAPGAAADATWLLGDSDRVPAPLHAVAFSRFTFTSEGSPTRPFATGLGSPASTVELGGELGLLPGLSVVAVGLRGEEWSSRSAASGALAGLRWAPLAAGAPLQLVASAGWLHELGGHEGAWGRVSLGWRSGDLRTTLAAHGEHVFAGGRDGIDLMVLAGASYGLTRWLRAGVEYVGQDLESALEDDAEGGARHLLGPTAALSLLGDRLTVTAGPAVALGGGSTHLLGRINLAAGF
jgi:hypothetical protein